MTNTPDTSRAALEALAAFHERMAASSMAFAGVSDVYKMAITTAATLRALAARVIELEAENARLRKREHIMRGLSPSVSAMLDDYDTPVAALEVSNAE
jgi:hypothetical protein